MEAKTKDELEQELSELKATLATTEADKQKALADLAAKGKFSIGEKVAAAQAGAGPQPSPSLVTPSMVWDHKLKKPVPYEAPPSARFRVESPNAKFTGGKGGVPFRNGVGYTDDADLIPWFTDTLGYAVTDTLSPKETVAGDGKNA